MFVWDTCRMGGAVEEEEVAHPGGEGELLRAERIM